MSPDDRATHVRAVLVSLIAAVAQVPLGLWSRHRELSAGAVPLIDATGRSYWLVAIVVALVIASLFQLLDRDSVYVAGSDTDSGVRYEPMPVVPTTWI